LLRKTRGLTCSRLTPGNFSVEREVWQSWWNTPIDADLIFPMEGFAGAVF